MGQQQEIIKGDGKGHVLCWNCDTCLSTHSSLWGAGIVAVVFTVESERTMCFCVTSSAPSMMESILS
jgi:hypothetical protein